ncbi:DUF4113 domain-containing protein [Raoultella terrigena]|uniref:DUF4113 domain-containing protein n=1 Tax=Raoultella terrigena TaxID=577 RepID=UPI00338E7FF0
MELLDSINYSGKEKLWFSSQGVQCVNADWKMCREHLSPCRTTRGTDVLKVK